MESLTCKQELLSVQVHVATSEYICKVQVPLGFTGIHLALPAPQPRCIGCLDEQLCLEFNEMTFQHFLPEAIL